MGDGGPIIEFSRLKRKGAKASDYDLVEAYRELRSVAKVGARFGMNGSSAHERLAALGIVDPPNLFTEEEKDRLREEYWIAAETGKLSELALDMGRTKHFLCRQARALGLTDARRKKMYLSTWKYVGEESARIIFEQFKRQSLGVGKYCTKKGYDDLGFSRCMQRHFPDEWEHVIESKQTTQTLYRYGRQFEYKVRDDLKKLGYFALRSPASKSPIDILAVKHGTVLMIQCKRHGALPPKEWNAIFDLASSCGAIPVLASCPTGRGAVFHRLIGAKDGSRRAQPMAEFVP